MGVPGFFAWLLKKYNSTKLITESINTNIDILYIDANCLFHPQCFKVLYNYKCNQSDLYKALNVNDQTTILIQI